MKPPEVKITLGGLFLCAQNNRGEITKNPVFQGGGLTFILICVYDSKIKLIIWVNCVFIYARLFFYGSKKSQIQQKFTFIKEKNRAHSSWRM